MPPRLEGDRLYGRGACDAKGIAAAMMCAAERLAAAGEERVDLLFVVGEEKGSDGARAANHLPATSRFLVNGEPTESKLASGAKGSQRVIVRTRGRAAHSAYAHLGAVGDRADARRCCRRVEVAAAAHRSDARRDDGQHRRRSAAAPRRTSSPRTAEAELMFRLVGDVAPLGRRVDAVGGRQGGARVGSHIPAQHFHTIPGFEVAPVAYTSDIPLLGRWGTPLLFGPGSIHVAHTPDEYIDVDELRARVDAYERIARTLLAT